MIKMGKYSFDVNNNHSPTHSTFIAQQSLTYSLSTFIAQQSLAYSLSTFIAQLTHLLTVHL
jgi:hypothetical protein